MLMSHCFKTPSFFEVRCPTDCFYTNVNLKQKKLLNYFIILDYIKLFVVCSLKTKNKNKNSADNKKQTKMQCCLFDNDSQFGVAGK